LLVRRILADLKVDRLTLALPYKTLLQPVSFTIAAGQVVVVTGATGAGKTLLLRLLNRLVEPTGGQISWAGQDYRSIPPSQYRRQIALVAAEPDLLGMTVQEALMYPLLLQQLPPAVMERRLIEVLSSWPIPEDWLTKRATELTLADCQRVAVARCLMMEPQVLLLDDVARHLPPEAWLELRSISQKLCMSLVTTGRNLVAERVLYLRHGHLLWDRPALDVDWDALGEEIDRTAAAEAADWE
jgi:D-methionine transport system ATP-binding protein